MPCARSVLHHSIDLRLTRPHLPNVERPANRAAAAVRSLATGRLGHPPKMPDRQETVAAQS